MFSLKRRSGKPAVRVITLIQQSHAGQDGYEAYIDGERVAWGATQSAAVAAARVSTIPVQRIAS